MTKMPFKLFDYLVWSNSEINSEIRMFEIKIKEVDPMTVYRFSNSPYLENWVLAFKRETKESLFLCFVNNKN